MHIFYKYIVLLYILPYFPGNSRDNDQCSWTQCTTNFRIRVQAWSHAQTGAPNFRAVYALSEGEL